MKFPFPLVAVWCCVAALLLVPPGPANLAAQDEKTEEATNTESTTESDSSIQETDDGKTEQENETTTEAVETDDSLDGLKKQWIEINKKLDAQQVLYDEAEDATRPDEQTKYEALIEEANAIVQKMKEAAIAELPAAEDKKSLFETLLGIMIDDATNDRGTEVMRVGHVLIENDVASEYLDKAANAKRLRLPSRVYFEELKTQLEQKDTKLPQVKISTSKGDIVVELFEKEAPDTVGNFVSLVEKGFYDGLTFHRVMDEFMAQGGDPKGDGSGGPGYDIYSEFDNEGARKHFPGSLSMANSGPNTGGSQFFLCMVRPDGLDGKHTVFGRIIEGMDVLDKLQRINPQAQNQPDPDSIVKMEVLQKTDGVDYKPNIVPGSEENDKAGEEKGDDESSNDSGDGKSDKNESDKN